ncbi:hypothetical protein [Halodesulfovibrio sp.]|jgi:hypothetical protein|uniref:hypothetical protein n=1 Tax=Halodesulfovibrio sp. TaxID=1912772 RepID=UPI0025FE3D12|nr:hypothetical protein [Halodesulfovibrio sp.]MCT4627728.1 hypothetical protein [Halodesulfovibrio sp.]
MSKSEEFIEAYYVVLLAFFEKYKKAMGQGQPVPDFPSFVLRAEVWSAVFKQSAPRVEYLSHLLIEWPSFVSRAELGTGAYKMISKSAIIKADGSGEGPRVRIKIGNAVWYPTAYLLEYLEDKKRMKVIISDKFDTKK